MLDLRPRVDGSADASVPVCFVASAAESMNCVRTWLNFMRSQRRAYGLHPACLSNSPPKNWKASCPSLSILKVHLANLDSLTFQRCRCGTQLIESKLKNPTTNPWQRLLSKAEACTPSRVLAQCCANWHTQTSHQGIHMMQPPCLHLPW